MNEETATESTMRQLLARWAELEPTRCETKAGPFPIFLDKEDWRYLAHDLTFWDLIWIQGVVQQALIDRGWSATLRLVIYPANRYWMAIVRDQPRPTIGSDPAQALLAAYLQALENK